MGHVILYIDDVASNLFLVEMLLKDYGATLETASAAETGMEMVQTKRYDLIFSDIHLPNADGFEVLQYIRQSNVPNYFTPVIAFTADNTAVTKSRIVSTGFTDIITKPFKASDLRLLLEIYLNPSPIELDWTYYSSFLKEQQQMETVRKMIGDDLKLFEVELSRAWHEKNRKALREQLHKVEVIVSNLTIQPLIKNFSVIRTEDAFTDTAHRAFREIKRDLLQIFQKLNAL
jgi:CheY-like chemotaxis protein